MNREGDRKSDTDTDARTKNRMPRNTRRLADEQRETSWEAERDDQKETMNDWPNARG